MPDDKCIECGASAAHLCTECLNEEQIWGTLCAEYAETHPHQNYGEPFLLVNSRRLGMCNCDAPAEPLCTQSPNHLLVPAYAALSVCDC